MAIALSGSLVITGSIFATQGITGSFSGSATSASYADTLQGLGSASFAPAATFNTVSQSFATTSGSLSTRVTNLESTSSTVSSSFASTSGSIAGRVTLIEGQYATTGSNTFTGPQYVSQASNAISFTSTASLYTDGGLRVTKDSFVSGTAYFNNVVVYGTSSIQYITSSQVNFGTNIITVNTDTPAVRFGGLAVFDSGSTQLTGSMLWDSEKNHWIYSNPSGSTYNSAMLMNGPRNTGSLGSEQGTTSCALMMGQGGDHITSSMIYSYGNATCFYGQSFIDSSGAACFAGTVCAPSAIITNNLTVGGTSPIYLNFNAQASCRSRVAILYRGTQSGDACMIAEYGVPYLSIGGQENLVNSIQTIGFGFTNGTTYTQPAEIGFQTTSTSGYTCGDLVFATRGATTNTVPTERLRITSTGVACFSSTVCVGGDLSVVSAGSTTALFDGTNPTLTLRRNNNGNASAAINFKGSSAVKWQIGTNQAIGLGFEINEGDATANKFYIAPGGAATFACSITADSLNINTSTVFVKASIADTLTATSIGSNYNPGILNIQNKSATNGNLSLIGFQDASQFINLAAMGAINETHAGSPNNVTGALAFYTKTSGTGFISERMRITNAGNVLLACSTDNNKGAKLQIVQGGSNTNAIDIKNSDATYAHYGTFANNTYLTQNYYYAGGQNNDCSGYGQAAITLGVGTVIGETSIDFAMSDPGATSPSSKMRLFSAGILLVGTTTCTAEANLILGAKGTTEGGQMIFQKGTSFQCATHIDNYSNCFRIMSGTDTSSTTVNMSINHTNSAATFGGSVTATTITGTNGVNTVSTVSSIPFTTWTTLATIDSNTTGMYLVVIGLTGGGGALTDWTATGIVYSNGSTAAWLTGPTNGSLIQLRISGLAIQVFQNGTNPSISLSYKLLKIS